jgi:hypothetical protein
MHFTFRQGERFVCGFDFSLKNSKKIEEENLMKNSKKIVLLNFINFSKFSVPSKFLQEKLPATSSLLSAFLLQAVVNKILEFQTVKFI